MINVMEFTQLSDGFICPFNPKDVVKSGRATAKELRDYYIERAIILNDRGGIMKNNIQFKNFAKGQGRVQVIHQAGSMPMVQIMSSGITREITGALYCRLIRQGMIVEKQRSKSAVSHEVIYCE